MPRLFPLLVAGLALNCWFAPARADAPKTVDQQACMLLLVKMLPPQAQLKKINVEREEPGSPTVELSADKFVVMRVSFELAASPFMIEGVCEVRATEKAVRTRSLPYQIWKFYPIAQ